MVLVVKQPYLIVIIVFFQLIRVSLDESFHGFPEIGSSKNNEEREEDNEKGPEAEVIDKKE